MDIARLEVVALTSPRLASYIIDRLPSSLLHCGQKCSAVLQLSKQKGTKQQQHHSPEQHVSTQVSHGSSDPQVLYVTKVMICW